MNEEERAKAALEFLTLSEVLEWSGMTEEDTLAFLLYHGAIRIPDEVFELKEEDGQDL